MEFSGSGSGITLNVHDNDFHDTANWDTGMVNAFHHNGIHIFRDNPDSSTVNFYNNKSYGAWGSCCTTDTMIFTEITQINLMNVFNNLQVQPCDGQKAPSMQLGMTAGVVANNTFIGCASQSPNDPALQVFVVDHADDVKIYNNFIEGYGQHFIVKNFSGVGAVPSVIDYNIYGPVGISASGHWVCLSSATNTFSTWKSDCSADTNGSTQASPDVDSTTGMPNSGASPLVGAGVDLSSLGITALNSDRIGTPRTAPWTVGAFQISDAAPVIVSTSPTSGFRAMSYTVSLVGNGTSWTQVDTYPDMDNSDLGVAITSWTVADSSHMSFQLIISAGATLGPRNIYAITGAQTLTLTNGFLIQSQSAPAGVGAGKLRLR
jgi:hypothetical protein